MDHLEFKPADVLGQFLDRYRESGRSIAVCFRRLVPSLTRAEHGTHLIHPYPAKLLMHIPHFFLSNNVLSKPGDLVLDPFCGSGTVLLESLLAGRNAIGSDTNPLAQLISRVKTTLIDSGTLRQARESLLAEVSEKPSVQEPDVVNLSHWFYPHVTRQLSRLLEAIGQADDGNVREFMLVCFSNCLRKVSLADPRLSVPVRLRYGKYPEGHYLREKMDRHLRALRRVSVVDQFGKVFWSNYKRLDSLREHLPTNVRATVLCSDARALSFDPVRNNGSNTARLRDSSVDLIITSPPYAGAQKYIRASSLSLGWLGLCRAVKLRELEGLSIGREHYRKEMYSEPVDTGIRIANKLLEGVRLLNPLRAHIAATYLVEMREAFREMVRVLKPNRHIVLIAANNEVCGQEFETTEYLTIIAKELGLSLVLRLIDDIRSRGLMTKRNRTASVIAREWVLIFRKDVEGHGRA